MLDEGKPPVAYRLALPPPLAGRYGGDNFQASPCHAPIAPPAEIKPPLEKHNNKVCFVSQYTLFAVRETMDQAFSPFSQTGHVRAIPSHRIVGDTRAGLMHSSTVVAHRRSARTIEMLIFSSAQHCRRSIKFRAGTEAHGCWPTPANKPWKN